MVLGSEQEGSAYLADAGPRIGVHFGGAAVEVEVLLHDAPGGPGGCRAGLAKDGLREVVNRSGVAGAGERLKGGLDLGGIRQTRLLELLELPGADWAGMHRLGVLGADLLGLLVGQQHLHLVEACLDNNSWVCAFQDDKGILCKYGLIRCLHC